MPHEIEAKFPVENFVAVRQALVRLGAKLWGTVIETDQFFDTPECSLRKNDCGLRIRTYQVVGKGSARPALVTYKGPKAKSTSLKIRKELQTEVADPALLGGIFESLGFERKLTVRKRRSSYQLRLCRVELDELAGIGRFVEVEGPTESAVQNACRKLGLTDTPITTSYVSMVAAKSK